MAVRDMTSLLGGERMIGNEALREQLQTEILDGRLSHAYILEGARGMGKHLLAMEICAAISCLEKGEQVLPCGHCRSCEKILQGKSPDIHVIGKNGKASVVATKTLHANAKRVYFVFQLIFKLSECIVWVC